MANHGAIDWPAHIKAQAAKGRQAVQRLVESCRASDFESFVSALVVIDELFIHRKAFLRLARLSPPTAKFRRLFRDRVWLRFGDHFRQEIGDDLLLCDVLRILMPPYRGTARRLYRGERAFNWRRRTYSIPWTKSRAVADSFAQGMTMRTADGGSVVLETVAPRAAIICRVPSKADRYGEREYLVDRRRLKKVRVIARHSMLTHEQYAASHKQLTREIGPIVAE